MSRTQLLVGMALLLALGFLLGRRGGEAAAPPHRWASHIQEVFSLTDRLEQARRLIPILDALDADTLDVSMDALESTFASGGGDPVSMALVMEAWVEVDALRAFERVREWPFDVRRVAMPPLVRAWARRFPDLALEELDGLPDDAIRIEALHELVRGWAESEHAGLWRYLAGQETERDRERLMAIAFNTLLRRHGAVGLLKRVELLREDPELADFVPKAFRSVLTVIARVDGPLAAEFAERQMAELPGERLMRRTAVHWVTSDPPAALAWVRSQPPGEERDRVIRETFRRWVVHARPDAIAWMAAQEDRRGLSPIFDIHASAVAREDAHAAIAWADAEIEDPVLRREALLDVAQIWLAREPELATAWIAERGLEQEVQRLIEERRRRPRRRSPAHQGQGTM